MNHRDEQYMLAGIVFFGFGISIGQFYLLFFATNYKFFYVYLSLFIAEVLFFALVSWILYKKIDHKKNFQKMVNEYIRAEEEIKEHQQSKHELISIASHQLRTPLSILTGYIELLRDEIYGSIPANMKEVFQNMSITNERLLRVVEHFLCVGEAHHQAISYRFEKEDISKILEKVIRELRTFANLHDVTIRTNIEQDIFEAVDKHKIQHIFYNIIENAIKYASKNPIYISLKIKGNKIVWVCKDRGIGLSKAEIKKLFNKFYRTDNAVNSQIMGTGLGLFVCKTFVEGHKGTILYSSSGKNKGTTAVVKIPYKQR